MMADNDLIERLRKKSPNAGAFGWTLHEAADALAAKDARIAELEVALAFAIEGVVNNLSELKAAAVLGVEKDGNGAHIYQIEPLAKLGLMTPVPIEKLMGARIE